MLRDLIRENKHLSIFIGSLILTVVSASLLAIMMTQNDIAFKEEVTSELAAIKQKANANVTVIAENVIVPNNSEINRSGSISGIGKPVIIE